VITIDAKGLFESISAGQSLLLIDVRQPEELVYGTLEGAHNYPLTDIPNRLSELEKLINDQNQETEIVVFCRMGGRSEQVISFLERRGSRELANLVGGTLEYSEFNDKIQKY